MSKVLAIFGATGQQGGSVLNFVLNDPELSQQYKIRAITRDTTSDKAKHLREVLKVEVVQGDFEDKTSLTTALKGAHTIYSMTTTTDFFKPNPFDAQEHQAKLIADVAVEVGAQYLIFSTLPSWAKLSGGKYTKVGAFEAKHRAEQYIRGLPIRSAFVAMGGYMQNFYDQTFLGPRQDPDGTWVLSRVQSPGTEYPLIDCERDTGKFVGAILAAPDEFEGKTLYAAGQMYTIEEITAALAKSSGKKIVYRVGTEEDLTKTLPPVFLDMYLQGNKMQDEFGYFGPEGRELVAESAVQARGKLSTLEEFLERHPFSLE